MARSKKGDLTYLDFIKFVIGATVVLTVLVIIAYGGKSSEGDDSPNFKSAPTPITRSR